MLNEIFFFIVSHFFFLTFSLNGFLIEQGRMVHDMIINEENL